MREILITTLLTTLCNIVIVYIVFRMVDKPKISYEAITKERIGIYRNLWTMIYTLQNKLAGFVYSGIGEECFKKMKEDINAFNNYCLINQPFITTSLFDKFKKIHSELQSSFEDLYTSSKEQDIEKSEQKWLKSRNKLLGDYFQPIQQEIITQMRKEFHIK